MINIMIPVIAGLSGGIAAMAVDHFKWKRERVREEQRIKEQTRFLAMQCALVLETFLRRCQVVLSEWDAHKHSALEVEEISNCVPDFP